ncbi:MAG: hypothetical protein OXR67_17065 [Chloroflexota bacterium]|nr:hypothetical protein [Chloroflexota bacterium]
MIDEQAAGLRPTENIVDECSHHWVIQEGDGPTSVGMCRVCGALKEFKNYLEASFWGDKEPRSDSRPNLLGRPSRTLAIVEDDEDF